MAVVDNEARKPVLDFLRTQLLGVVSTLDAEKGRPAAATVAFSETENLELIFGTFDNTRKFANLRQNPYLAFVIACGDISVQYEGLAHLAQGKEAEECRSIHLAKNPKSKKYAFHERQRFIKVSPRWIRYSDFSFDPEHVFEIRF